MNKNFKKVNLRENVNTITPFHGGLPHGGYEISTPEGDFILQNDQIHGLYLSLGGDWFRSVCKTNGWDYNAFETSDIDLITKTK